eukprot:gene12111-13763_t
MPTVLAPSVATHIPFCRYHWFASVVVESDIGAMEDLLQRNIQQTEVLFQGVNPYVPPNPAQSLKRKLKELALEEEELKVARHTETSFASASQPEIKLLGYDDSAQRQAQAAATASSSSSTRGSSTVNHQQLVTIKPKDKDATPVPQATSNALARYNQQVPTPSWHAPWELSAVISGHLGWVRSIAFDPSNEWFATGSADRTIKIWDLAKCCAGADDGLKLTLTGHINAVRGLVVSPRHPYLFSAGEDNQVKCWDLEYNKVIRHYHGHLSGVFALAIHPLLDVLVSGGRDCVARVWDIRTKNEVTTLAGHDNTVGAILTHGADPQVVTGSYDSTIKLWDLVAGRTLSTLTHHKKAVRSLASHRQTFTFASGAADNLKKWKTRDGTFMQNLSGHNTSINALAVNDDNVLVSGGDNGSLHFWDYETGYCFQKTQTIVQSGSLDAEAGIYAMSFDMSGSRLVTCEADKSIKIWKENATATPETHPMDLDNWTREYLALKRH